jgi:hypothetical protein
MTNFEFDERLCFKSAEANCGPAMFAYDLEQARAEFLGEAAQIGWTSAHSQALARWAKEHPLKSTDEDGFYQNQRQNCRMAGFLHPSEWKDFHFWKARLQAVERRSPQPATCSDTCRDLEPSPDGPFRRLRVDI